MEAIVLLALAAAATMLARALIGAFTSARADVSDDALAEDADTRALGELAERREMVMQLILSTTLDHQTGKISDDDHARTTARLKREAVALMKQMDAIGGSDADLEDVDADLEAHLAAARSARADDAWSDAAMLRHGGVRPTEAT